MIPNFIRRSKIQLAKPQIVNYFSNLPNKVLTKNEISRILESHRKNWNLGVTLSSSKFLNFLLNEAYLKMHTFNYWNRTAIRYSWGEISIYPLIVSLEPGAYLSHLSAMFFNELTDQIPKVIYLNFEQTAKPKPISSLEQQNIDRAFKNKQRTSNTFISHENYNICVLSGKFSDGLGVVEKKIGEGEIIRMTNIERTLIDITVRPNYSGGVYEILKAYRAALGKVSSNRLSAILQKLDYIYPYHQAIGFYMQKAGYSESSLNILKQFGFKFDFYLAHAMKEIEYDKEWRIFYPKGF